MASSPSVPLSSAGTRVYSSDWLSP
jgi:hypothetical protein